MGKQVCAGAMIQCSFGAAPGSLVVLPVNKVFTTTPAANILDSIPMLNILPFGMCKSMANPTVAAATAAAMGALTPMPCMPLTPAPWSPGSSTVKLGGMPALQDSSKLDCVWGGSISIKQPGQQTVSIP